MIREVVLSLVPGFFCNPLPTIGSEVLYVPPLNPEITVISYTSSLQSIVPILIDLLQPVSIRDEVKGVTYCWEVVMANQDAILISQNPCDKPSYFHVNFFPHQHDESQIKGAIGSQKVNEFQINESRSICWIYLPEKDKTLALNDGKVELLNGSYSF